MSITERKSRKFRFSKKLIDALPPNKPDARSREQEYSDEQVVGLRILVNKKGVKKWLLRYVLNKRKLSLMIGSYPAFSLQEARDKANLLKNQVYNGLDPRVERDKQSDAITFSEFVEKEYIPHAREHKKSWKDDVGKLENDMLAAFSPLPLSAINALDIQRYLTKIKARTSASTCNRHYTLLCRIFNLAIQWQFLETNPCKSIKKQKESGGKERYLNDEELKRFLSVLDEVPQNVSAYSLRFLLFTGLRMSEALQLEWENVDMDKGSIFLPETKAGKGRNVAMNDLAMNVLLMMKDFTSIDGYVFPGKGGQSYLKSPKRTFEIVKKVADIQGFRVHDLRHTFASLAVNSGTSLYQVQKLLGHQSSQMTQRYAHLGDKELRAATDSVANSIGKTIA